MIEAEDIGDPSAGMDSWAEGRAATAEGEFGLPVLVTLLRADPVAGIALVLAGVAAVASLWLPWWRGDAVTGQVLVRRGLAAAGSGSGALGRTVGLWEPPAIVLGGMPCSCWECCCSSRRGPIGSAGCSPWSSPGGGGRGSAPGRAGRLESTRFGPGMWAAVVVAALGILGALKAMLTAPRVTLRFYQPGTDAP